jgi:hypothetical protein
VVVEAAAAVALSMFDVEGKVLLESSLPVRGSLLLIFRAVYEASYPFHSHSFLWSAFH